MCVKNDMYWNLEKKIINSFFKIFLFYYFF